MENFLSHPPSRKLLKKTFLDGFRRDRRPSEMNCVAHMILDMEDPAAVTAVALDYLIDTIQVCRADFGFAAPSDETYTPLLVNYNQSTDPPRCNDARYSNRAAVFRKAWSCRKPVTCDAVDLDPKLRDVREEFTSIESKSILFQQLDFLGRPVGMMCLDFTTHPHVWSASEQEKTFLFAKDFFGPIVMLSKHWSDRSRSLADMRRPSDSELDVIRLVADGLDYHEIAEALGKSPRTVENQLRNARLSLQAANRAELIRKCEVWL